MKNKNGAPMQFIEIDSKRARVQYRTPQGKDREYQRAKAQALSSIHTINSRELRISARQFDGIM